MLDGGRSRPQCYSFTDQVIKRNRDPGDEIETVHAHLCESVVAQFAPNTEVELFAVLS